MRAYKWFAWALRHPRLQLHNCRSITWMLHNRHAFAAAALLFQWRHGTAMQTRAHSRKANKNTYCTVTSGALSFRSCMCSLLNLPVSTQKQFAKCRLQHTLVGWYWIKVWVTDQAGRKICKLFVLTGKTFHITLKFNSDGLLEGL